MPTPEVVRVYQRWPSWVGEPSQLEAALTAFDALAQDSGDGGPTGAVSAATCVVDGVTERQGEWHTVLDQVDPTAVTKLTVAIAEPFRAPRGDLRIEFSRRHGVVLEANAEWFDHLERSDASLQRAIRSGVPRFAWLRSQIGGAVFMVAFAVLVEAAALLLFSSRDTVALVVAFPVGLLIAAGIWGLLGRRFPRFRIVGTSRQPRPT